MSLPANYFFIVDLVIVLIFVICMAISYHNGLIYELISLFMILISLFLAFLFSPIFAKKFYLVKPDLSDPLLNMTAIYNGINTVIWFIILVILFCLLFMLLKPLFKKFTKVPLVGWVNKLFGIIIGFVKGLFVCFIISYLLNLSIFKNGDEIKNSTFIKYSDDLSRSAMTFVIKNIDFDKINDGIDNFDADSTRDAIENFFINRGN